MLNPKIISLITDFKKKITRILFDYCAFALLQKPGGVIALLDEAWYA